MLSEDLVGVSGEKYILSSRNGYSVFVHCFAGESVGGNILQGGFFCLLPRCSAICFQNADKFLYSNAGAEGAKPHPLAHCRNVSLLHTLA